MKLSWFSRNARRAGGVGIALALAVAGTLVAASFGFLDPLSLLITVGGALAVARATFSSERIASTWWQMSHALRDTGDTEAVITHVKRLARIHRVDGLVALEQASANAPDAFLRTAIEMALDCREENELRDALVAQARTAASEGEAARHVMLTLGKLFPAFGLIGTLSGLALLLRHLASADIAAIGPGLALAVMTTLYGAVLSNVVVLPLATKLQTHLTRRGLIMQMVIEGTVLIFRKEYPTRIERALRGYVGVTVDERSPRTPSGAPIHLTERAA
jgi:chemotaxis protein MotA